jgi:hypothetical protein
MIKSVPEIAMLGSDMSTMVVGTSWSGGSRAAEAVSNGGVGNRRGEMSWGKTYSLYRDATCGYWRVSDNGHWAKMVLIDGRRWESNGKVVRVQVP